jgi:hypothetical protein
MTQWQIAQSDCRRYALVCGARDPFPLTKWAPRLMGVGSPIIYGRRIRAKSRMQLVAWIGRRVTKIDGHVRSAVPLRDSVALGAHS